jgi:hypothetical protein
MKYSQRYGCIVTEVVSFKQKLTIKETTMKQNKLVHGLIILTIAAVILFSTTLHAQCLKKITIPWKGRMVEVIEDQIGIKVKVGVTASVLIRAVESLGFTVLDSPDDMSMARLQVPRSMNILEALEKVRYTSFVEGADPITIMHVSATPNDQYYSNQFYRIQFENEGYDYE